MCKASVYFYMERSIITSCGYLGRERERELKGAPVSTFHIELVMEWDDVKNSSTFHLL